MAEIFDENNIPGLDLDVETIDSNAATLKTKAGDLRSAGSSIKTTWSGVSACYKAPEQEQLYAAMNPVEKNTGDLADDLEKIAGYVNTFADTARQIKSDAQTLKKDGQAFKKKIAAEPDWQTKQELVDENTSLVNRASGLKIRLWDAERTCANNIRALDCLAPYHVNPNSDNDKLWYGYSQIPADADKPWGKSVERQDNCPKKAAVSVKRFVWDGLVVDGIGGSINGVANLLGLDFSGNGDIWSSERLSNTWSAATGLVGRSTDENGNSTWSWGKAWDTWKGVGAAAVHAKEWGTDPARALGATVFDVASLVIPVVGAASKAGKFGKAGSALSKVGKGVEVAAKVMDVMDPVGAALAKPIGKVSNVVVSRLLPDFDIIETVGKWTGANADVNVGSGSRRGFDMNNPDASVLEPDVSNGNSRINAGDSSVSDVSSKPHSSEEGISTNDLGRPRAGSADTMPTDVGNAADMPGQSQSRSGVTDASHADTGESPRAMNGSTRGSDNAADRVGVGVDGHESRQTTPMHGSDKSHSESVADGRKANDGGRELAGRDGDATEARGGSRHADGDTGRADADGRRESAKDGADPAGGTDRDRAGRGADADAGRNRADHDAAEGHEHVRDAGGRRVDADGHRGQAKNDADAGNNGDHDRTGRNGDSDGERDWGKTDSDATEGRDRARHADGDTGRADADGRAESAKDGGDPAGGRDRDRAGRDADADAGRNRADHDEAEGHEHVRDAGGRRVDADGHHDQAKNHADTDNNGDHDRTGRDGDSDGERDRGKTDSDATEGRDRARHADGDTGRADADGRAESAKDGGDPAGGRDRDRAGRDADADAGRNRADHDEADGHEHVRDADGRRVDADGHHDQAKNHADTDNNGDHDRTDRNSDSDGERDRGKTDSDATEGRDRARQGDGDGSHTDGEERSKHGKNDTDAANGADHDGAGRNGDSDGESGRDKGNGDGSGEFPDGTRKEPLTVEERQQWIDQVDQNRDQDAFNEKHRTAGPELKPEHQRTLGIDEQFGVGEKLDANAHYEVTRTTDDGVSYKSHYYTDASGEVRHVETSSRAMTGAYNPDLRNPLPNATYTVDGRFHYTTDGWARTVRLEVDRLDVVGEAFRSRSSYIQSKVNKYGSELAADIDQRYEGGHIVGDQFGGPPEEINTVAMLEEVNQTRVGKESNSYLLLERKFAAKPENYNNLVVEFKYSDPADPAKMTNTERVPEKFEARWTNAAGEAKMKEFKNVLPAEQSGGN